MIQIVARPILIAALWIGLIVSLPYGWKPSAIIALAIAWATARSK